jgi:ATP-binding cassette subfamily C exporter for protease/lipase
MITQPPNFYGKQNVSLLTSALLSQSAVYWKALGFSMVTSILVLAPTVFMLEVYDRVINSSSETTLVSLLICLVGIYVLMEVIGMLRSRLLHQAGWRFDSLLRECLYDASFVASIRHGALTQQSFSDLRTLREFIASSAVTAAMDAPASGIFLLLITCISPWLGLVALFGAIVQVLLGISTENKTMPLLTEANKAAISAQNYANEVLRNTQVISAMGMNAGIFERWIKRQRKFLLLQAKASDAVGTSTSISKFTQTMQTSLILGLSCWLALKGSIQGGGGMMIVASTLGGRVLSPLVQLIGQWRSVVHARDAYERLDNFLSVLPTEHKPLPLPSPQGSLSVENVVAAAPGGNLPIIKGVSFALQPGETLMIVGPSAAGKTTLAKVLLGIWPVASGKVRLDGADLHAWDKHDLGPHLGYLPQEVQLFDGTLSENIARFSDIDMAKVKAATALVGLTAMVDALPGGFETRIGKDGSVLSGGQRQRVGIARAIYADPNFVLFDEPNSSLDEAGEQALITTLRYLKARECTTIVITHRTNLLPEVDKILILQDGQTFAFGARDEVLTILRQTNSARPLAAAPQSAR